MQWWADYLDGLAENYQEGEEKVGDGLPVGAEQE